MIGWGISEPETQPEQLALDVAGCRAVELAPDGEPDEAPAPSCANCTSPCPWGDPDADELSWAEWFALLPPTCSRSTTKT